MVQRSRMLQEFLTATREAVGARTSADTPAGLAMRRVGASLDASATGGERTGPKVLPACAYLDTAIAGAMQGPADIRRVALAIKAIAPDLSWRSKPSDDPVFAAGHANADIMGATAEALERRDDVRVGLSLMAPGITYPDHSHPPEEVYLALSRGLWRNEDCDWQEPGLGGVFYNRRGVTHAMRSGAEPLLAIWCLPID